MKGAGRGGAFLYFEQAVIAWTAAGSIQGSFRKHRAWISGPTLLHLVRLSRESTYCGTHGGGELWTPMANESAADQQLEAWKL